MSVLYVVYVGNVCSVVCSEYVVCVMYFMYVCMCGMYVIIPL